MTASPASSAARHEGRRPPRRRPSRTPLERGRAALAGLGAAILGAAPHVLHHVGPLAGAAVLAGVTGKLLFGVLGFVLAIPMLRRLRRHHGSWAIPGGVLALMTVVYAFSAFVIGPAVAGTGDDAPAKRGPSRIVPDDRPSGVSPAEHESHHG